MGKERDIRVRTEKRKSDKERDGRGGEIQFQSRKGREWSSESWRYKDIGIEKENEQERKEEKSDRQRQLDMQRG